MIYQAPVVQKLDYAIHWINLCPLDNAILVSLILICWILIYPLDSVINWDQALVVQKMDSTIHRINRYPSESIRKSYCAIQWIVIYPVDSTFHLLNNWHLVDRAVQHLNSQIQVDHFGYPMFCCRHCKANMIHFSKELMNLTLNVSS